MNLSATLPYAESGSCQERYVTLRLCIAPEMAYRVHDEFREDMVEKQADGSYIVTVTWVDGNWVYGFLLSFGEHIEVLAPEDMREAIRERAQKISEKYS